MVRHLDHYAALSLMRRMPSQRARGRAIFLRIRLGQSPGRVSLIRP